MPQDTPSRKLDQYIVRLPDGMRDRLKEAAAQSNRSMNAEIIYRLELTFGVSAPEPSHSVVRLPEPLAARISAAAERMRRSTEDQALATLEASYMPIRRGDDD